MPEDEVAALRRQLELRVAGFGCPRPVGKFGQCGFDAALLGAIKKAGWAAAEAPGGGGARCAAAACAGSECLPDRPRARRSYLLNLQSPNQHEFCFNPTAGCHSSAAAPICPHTPTHTYARAHTPAGTSSPRPSRRRRCPRRSAGATCWASPRPAAARPPPSCCPCWCTSWTSRSCRRVKGPSAWWWRPRASSQSRSTARPGGVGGGGGRPGRWPG
jgi:hypothetical protein